MSNFRRDVLFKAFASTLAVLPASSGTPKELAQEAPPSPVMFFSEPTKTPDGSCDFTQKNPKAVVSSAHVIGKETPVGNTMAKANNVVFDVKMNNTEFSVVVPNKTANDDREHVLIPGGQIKRGVDPMDVVAANFPAFANIEFSQNADVLRDKCKVGVSPSAPPPKLEQHQRSPLKPHHG